MSCSGCCLQARQIRRSRHTAITPKTRERMTQTAQQLNYRRRRLPAYESPGGRKGAASREPEKGCSSVYCSPQFSP